MLGRLAAQKLSAAFGQQFVPENFAKELTKPALIVRPMGPIRGALKYSPQPPEIYDPSGKDLPPKDSAEASEVRYLSKIADFLDRNLK